MRHQWAVRPTLVRMPEPPIRRMPGDRSGCSDGHDAMGCHRNRPDRPLVRRRPGHHPGATIAAVGSRRLESARSFAAAYGVARAYGSYDEVAADPDVDVVYVATPH